MHCTMRMQTLFVPCTQAISHWSLSFIAGGLYKGHVEMLAPTVQELASLEKEAQTSFLRLGYLPNQLFRTF